jgi:hypothetical protein
MLVVTCRARRFLSNNQISSISSSTFRGLSGVTSLYVAFMGEAVHIYLPVHAHFLFVYVCEGNCPRALSNLELPVAPSVLIRFSNTNTNRKYTCDTGCTCLFFCVVTFPVICNAHGDVPCSLGPSFFFERSSPRCRRLSANQISSISSGAFADVSSVAYLYVASTRVSVYVRGMCWAFVGREHAAGICRKTESPLSRVGLLLVWPR